jgi:hypothetical protein
MACPVDAGRTGVFFWRYRRVEGRQQDTWRFLCKTLIEKRHWEVLEQDRGTLEAIPADADQHDLGVVRLRRLFRAAADEQSGRRAPGAAPAHRRLVGERPDDLPQRRLHHSLNLQPTGGGPWRGPLPRPRPVW